MPIDENLRESHRQFFDLFKHLTTLNSGSILLIVTLLEKLFKQPEWRVLVAASLILFLFSLATSVFSMFFYASLHTQDEIPKGAHRAMAIFTAVFALLSFVAGLVVLTIFSLKNISSP